MIQHISKKISAMRSSITSGVNLAKTVPLLLTNTSSHGVFFWVTGVPALLLPMDNKFRQGIEKFNVKVGFSWVEVNTKIIDHLLPEIEWDISLPEDLSPEKKYLLICNHQTWLDTTVMQYVGFNRLPFVRFFTKYELIYIPILGQAFKVLGFPMMKRHSKEAIAKNPKLRTQDFLEAQKSCQNMKQYPFTLLNFVEGTRFTEEKHKNQQSEYQHLLQPKYGGMALATEILGDDIDAILDMTIIYPDGAPEFVDFWKGKVPKIIVNITKEPIPEWLNEGSYHTDADYKAKFKDWLNDIWAKKDAYIDETINKH